MRLQTADSKKDFELSPEVFDCKYNEGLIHQVVNAYMAGARAGTKAQKTRSEVRGGGAKPWRQKGTGRARAGTIRSPIWIGGGVTFAAKPRDFSQKVNRKMYRKAMCSILSELIRQERLVVLEDIHWGERKTRVLAAKLKELDLEHVLIVDSEISQDLRLAARNLPHVDVCSVTEIDPYVLLKFKKVCMSVDALNKIQEVMS